MAQKQWQYGMNVVFGLLLFFLPWLMGFQAALPLHGWDFFVTGAAIVAFALVALHLRLQLGAWANLILGAWMIVSPWLLGFGANVLARDMAMALGALVFLVTLWAWVERRSLETRSSPHASGNV
jgi:hypothetical protein